MALLLQLLKVFLKLAPMLASIISVLAKKQDHLERSSMKDKSDADFDKKQRPLWDRAWRAKWRKQEAKANAQRSRSLPDATDKSGDDGTSLDHSLRNSDGYRRD